MMTDLSTLNPEQRRAVETVDGPVLILAGAGSGKTRALTHRIAYLLDMGVPPYEILALTFTNKAAKEMKERVTDLAGTGGQLVWVSTFHACCSRILRIDIDKIGYTKDFVIYDDTDQLAAMSEIQKKLGLKEDEWPRRMLRGKISDMKNRDLAQSDIEFEEGGYRGGKIAEAKRLYDKLLLGNNALDFDDLLIKTIELFEKVPEVLEKYQRRFRYIHVDEYQDTNTIQYKLVRMLAAKHGNICVVGDDDQSIYGWRGADIRNILGFEKDFPGCTTLRLERNYRSTSNILDAANAVIAQNTERKPKKLWTDSGKGEKLTEYTAWSERDEADYVCRTVAAGIKNGKLPSDFAVLYRTNAQSRVLEEACTGYGLPYAVVGSLKFYDRAEIKDVIAYLRLIVNPKDDISFKRAVSVPKRGVGDAAIAELEQIAEKNDMSLLEVCMSADELPISGRVRGRVKPFGDMLLQLGAMAELFSPSALCEQVLNLANYWEYLSNENRADGRQEERVQNVKELVAAMVEFEKSAEENTLSSFLENVSLVANVNDETGAGAMALMTLHSAKGLEFPSVFIIGMEESIFPSSRALNQGEHWLEEERRLCYVGITRAKRKLYLTHAQSRMMYNSVQRNSPSRFLKEIPKELFDKPTPKKRESEVWTGEGEYSAANTVASASRHRPRDLSGSASLGGYREPKKPKKTYDFAPYMRVVHDKFGVGTISGVNGGVLTVDFESGGEKKIVASYAPIRPAEDE